MVKTSALILASFLVISGAHAQDSGGGGGRSPFGSIPERQKERRDSRWTLNGWMQTKRRIEEQNRWLWAHTNKIPLEFAAAYSQSPTRWRTDVDAFVARLGLRASFGKRVDWFKDVQGGRGPNDDTTQVAAQIRLFGGNLQDSYLMARVGYELAGFNNPGALGGNFGTWYTEPELQVYLAQWLGARGQLHYRFSGSNMTDKTQKWGGRTWEAVAFIEAGPLRIEGGHRWLNWEVDGVAPMKSTELVGALKIFF